MIREWALKILLVLVGLTLVAGIYPLATSLLRGRNSQVSAGDQMILGIYIPIGIFLLLAVRDLSANRSLIFCVGWSTLAHDAVMAVQSFQAGTVRPDALPLGIVAIICIVLIALTPPRKSGKLASAAVA